MATFTSAAARPCRGLRQALAAMCPEDRRLYESIPQVVTYVPHPDFRLRATEERLFGPLAEKVPAVRWRQFSALPEDASPPAKPRPHLSRHQESVLFLKYNYARYRLAAAVARQRRRFAASRVPEMLLWHRRARELRAAITSANMALVVALAKRTRINSVEFGELVSEGNMALLRAVDRFDASRGFKFSTYACRAIFKSFNRLATKVATYRQRFPTEFDPGMEASDELDRRHGAQRDLAVEDLRRVLEDNAAELTDVERVVVGARFALDGSDEVKTLEQVGQLVHLSKERVRQVQNAALVKLRAAISERSTGVPAEAVGVG